MPITCKICTGLCCQMFYAALLTEKDVVRLAAFLKIKPSTFKRKYCEYESPIERFARTIDGDPHEERILLPLQPCVFLSKQNQCKVYDARPRACHDFKPGCAVCRRFRKEHKEML